MVIYFFDTGSFISKSTLTAVGVHTSYSV